MVRDRTIFRVKKTRDFVIISRITLEDSRLSWEARGLHAFLLAKPDDWETCVQHLIKCSPASRDRVRRILKELIKFNYIIKVEQRTERGRYARPQYLVHESSQDDHFDKFIPPETENPSPVNPSSANPTPEYHPLPNKHNKQDCQINKNTTTISAFTWPKKLDPAYYPSILTLSKNTDSVVVQLLLDELAGQLDNIKNPVGYFRTLLRKHNSNQFVPARAITAKSSREKRKRTEKALEDSKKQSEENFLRLVKEKLGNAKD